MICLIFMNATAKIKVGQSIAGGSKVKQGKMIGNKVKTVGDNKPNCLKDIIIGRSNFWDKTDRLEVSPLYK